MKILNKLINKLFFILKLIKNVDRNLDQIKINQGSILAQLTKGGLIEDSNFKVFSKFGEDGIIQFLINNINIKNKTFIEFGVEDYTESNTRFLLMHNFWQGFIIDGGKRNVDKIKNYYFYGLYNLQASCNFVTKENINEVLNNSKYDYDLGLLSIDIDGNDYHVLEAINQYKPRILICEFNNLFELQNITVPYKPNFNRFYEHYSGNYQGASLKAINFLAEKKGYCLVAIDKSGTNAFFVRKNLLNNKVKKIDVNNSYFRYGIKYNFNKKGKLILSHDFNERRNSIIGMNVLNLETNKVEKFKK